MLPKSYELPTNSSSKPQRPTPPPRAPSLGAPAYAPSPPPTPSHTAYYLLPCGTRAPASRRAILRRNASYGS